MARAKTSRKATAPSGGRQGDLGLTFDPRRLSRCAILELMRIGAGLSYKELSQLTGIPRAKVIRLIRGAYARPRVAEINLLRDSCWRRLAARSSPFTTKTSPAFLTLEEAAELIAVKPAVMRRLICRDRSIGAVKVGKRIRIPAQGLARFVSVPRRSWRSLRVGDGMSIQDLARLLRVLPGTVRHSIRHGKIKATQEKWHGRVRIPASEVRRILKEGTTPLRPRYSDLPRAQR